MRPCLPSYENVNTLRKGGLNYASEWLLSIRLLMLVDGKADALGIAECVKISSICDAVLSSTTYTSWPVPSCFKLSFKMRREFLTGTLAPQARPIHPPLPDWRTACALLPLLVNAHAPAALHTVLPTQSARKREPTQGPLPKGHLTRRPPYDQNQDQSVPG